MRPLERANLFRGDWRGAGIMNNLPPLALLAVRGASSVAPFPSPSPSPTQRQPNARQIGPTKWPGTNSKLCAPSTVTAAVALTEPAELARSLKREAKMDSTWSAGQNAGPMAAAVSASRPTDGARGVKRRARREGLRCRRGRRIGARAARPPPSPHVERL